MSRIDATDFDMDDEHEVPAKPEVRLCITLSDGLNMEIGMVYDSDLETLIQASKQLGYEGEGIMPALALITPDDLKEHMGK